MVLYVSEGLKHGQLLELRALRTKQLSPVKKRNIIESKSPESDLADEFRQNRQLAKSILDKELIVKVRENKEENSKNEVERLQKL